MWQSIRTNVTWHAIPMAGMAAGTVFLVTNLVLAPVVLKVDATLIVRYFASLALGSDILTENNSLAIPVGVIVNYALAFLYTAGIAIIIHRWGLLVGIVGGGLLGLAIYGINLFTFTLLFDWFFAINSRVLLLSHAFFGMVAGGTYELLDYYDLPIQMEIMEARDETA